MWKRLEPGFANLPLLQGLSTRQRRRIREMTTVLPVPAGRTVISRGTGGEELVVVLKGGLDVLTDGRPTAHLTAGAFVGEIPLLLSSSNAATVVTSEDSVLAVISHRKLRRVLGEMPSVLEVLVATAAARIGTSQPIRRSAPIHPIQRRPTGTELLSRVALV